jgi:cobalamin biosynthesis Co2+ chelatase CbiK
MYSGGAAVDEFRNMFDGLRECPVRVPQSRQDSNIQINSLKSQVKSSQDHKEIIIISHHQSPKLDIIVSSITNGFRVEQSHSSNRC